MKKCLHKIILSLVLHAYSFENQLGDFSILLNEIEVCTHMKQKKGSEIKIQIKG